MAVKESSYNKLKRELKESKEKYNSLRSDFKKYANSDFGIKCHYDVLFKIEDETEKMIWNG